jgi:hypothetical protein
VDITTTTRKIRCESGFGSPEGLHKKRQRKAFRYGESLDERLFAFSYELLAHDHEHRVAFPAMIAKRGGAVSQHVLRKLLVQYIRGDLKAMPVKTSPEAVPDEAIAQFLVIVFLA